MSDDETLIFWDVTVRRQLTEPLAGRTGSLSSVAFSPDGTLLAVGTEEDRLTLWDVADRRMLGVPLQASPIDPEMCLQRPCSPVEAVEFTPDGSAVAAGTLTGGVVLWSLDQADWVDQACSRAGRGLTAAERDRWSLPDETPCGSAPQR